MFSALIVYGSTTGNTENVARIVEGILKEDGANVAVLDAAKAQANGLCNGYDLIFLGCSTWGDDSIELQDDFATLFENFDGIQAEGKDVAVFGCGDSSYTYFCGAVDAISEQLEKLGANVIDTLKIDGSPQQQKDEIEQWTQHVIEIKKQG